MKKGKPNILLVAHDRGGVNLLAPLLSYWMEKEGRIEASFLGTPEIEYEVSSFMPSAKLISRRYLVRRQKEHCWMFGNSELEAVLEGGKWDFILTGTSIKSDLEKNIWRLARKYSIPTAAICDMWADYKRRFEQDSLTVLPNLLLVLDERMALETKAILGNLIEIKIVGSPHFSHLIRVGKKWSRAARKVRFISEPVAAFFPEARIHEFNIAEIIIDALKEIGRTSDLVLRPHPQDDSEAWRRFAFTFRHLGVTIDSEPSWACYRSTRMAIGLASMMLMEYTMVGVPVASFHLPGSDETYYCLPEKELGITVLRSKSDLKDWLQDPPLPKVNPQFIQFHKSAIDRITELVLNRQF